VDPCSWPRASSEPDRDEDALPDGTATMSTTTGATVRWIASSTSASIDASMNESMECVRQHVGID